MTTSLASLLTSPFALLCTGPHGGTLTIQTYLLTEGETLLAFCKLGETAPPVPARPPSIRHA